MKLPGFLQGGSLLTVLTVIGVAVGIGMGLGLREKEGGWSDREVMYLKLPGDIFLRTLGALILPLIVSSLVSAVGTLDLGLSKKIGIRALVYYLGTTAGAAVMGLVLVITIRPGKQAAPLSEDSLKQCDGGGGSTLDTLLDLLRNAFPPNLVGAAIFNSKTITIPNDTLPYDDLEFEVVMQDGTNLMGLVIFAMVLGVTLGRMGEAGKPVLNFFTCLGDATMLITSKVVWTSPIAICFLVAGQLVGQKDIASVFENIGWYAGVVLLGLLIHAFIILPILFFALTRTLPFSFMRNMFQAIATAFGTASSSATLPITLRCLEEENKVDKRVTRFVIPIGATVNMNGTALYLPVAAIFVSQLCGQSLGIGQLISVSLISIATSIGAAGVPQIGMVLMVTVLNTIGLPDSFIAYVMPIDWLLERFRTAVNVLGDAVGAGIVAHMSKEDLARVPMPGAADGEDDKPSSSDLDVNKNEPEEILTHPPPYFGEL